MCFPLFFEEYALDLMAFSLYIVNPGTTGFKKRFKRNVGVKKTEIEKIVFIFLFYNQFCTNNSANSQTMFNTDLYLDAIPY